MTIGSVSFDCDAIDAMSDDEKIGNLGKRSVSLTKDDREIPFLPFEKKCSAAWLRPEAFLAMTRCSRFDIEGYYETKSGEKIGVKITMQGEELKDDGSKEIDNRCSDTNRDHSPDSRDRDFDKDINGMG